MVEHRSDESSSKGLLTDRGALDRRELLKRGLAFAGAMNAGVGLTATGAAASLAANLESAPASAPVDAKSEARKIAFDKIGNGDQVLLISGFPQTRRSWNRLISLLSSKFQTIPADLPSFGDSGILSAPATTENVGK